MGVSAMQLELQNQTETAAVDPKDEARLLAFMRRHKSMFINSDRSISPDRFDTFRIMLMREFDGQTVNIVSRKFLSNVRPR